MREIQFEFLGLLAFYDPPKENMIETITAFKKAGIKIKMVTGDFPETAISISNKISLSNSSDYLTGHDILTMNEDELKSKINFRVNAASQKAQEAIKAIGGTIEII